MKLLLTGSNGFLGRNIQTILKANHELITLDITNADISCDLSKEIPKIKQSPDIVLHTAGKAHSIPKTAKEEKAFYDINLQGTINLCSALKKNKLPQSFIFISTVAVYGKDEGENIDENQPLNGKSAYALSKIQAERYLTNWCDTHKIKLTILRPSLIAGPNPPGNLDSMIQGIKTGRYFSIAKGKANKSILMVEDIAHLVPLAAEIGGIYNVCDSKHPNFRELEMVICKQLNKSMPISIPLWLAKVMAKTGDLMGKLAPINSNKLFKIINPLTFNNEKAKSELGWKPLNVLEHFKIE